MRSGLYHKEVGMPAKALEAWLGQQAVKLSDHARQACLNDRYGKIDLHDGDSIEVEAEDIFEVEVLHGKPVKAMVRLAYDDARDMILALVIPSEGVAVVKTVWLNMASDKHVTLKKELYNKI